jgi:SAM-dependent methyltransferase
MTEAPRSSHGTGPGAVTPDGCAVDFYAQLPDYGEPAIVHDAAGAGASILELGCGGGRVTRPLAALGHQVVAVDESAEMLEHVRDAETVCARIEDLRLGRRFGAVLLPSHLINADDDTRSAFLAACRRHVADDGCVIVQQYPPEWFSAVGETETTRDGVIYRMRDVSHPAPNLVSASVEYLVGDKRWTQTFTATRLDETELAAALAAAGLRLDRYLTKDRSWFRAVPAAKGRMEPTVVTTYSKEALGCHNHVVPRRR